MNMHVHSLSCLVRMTCRAPLVLLAAMIPLSASAALGGDMESVQADQAAMDASQRISAATDNYTVYELQTPTGIIIREYVSMSGTVFAVSWQGPLLPNLRQLLGPNFAKYTDAATSQRDGHGHLEVQMPDLVVESNGRVRSFFGQAYLPKCMPEGVAVTDIQ
jgi:hypothetical protein